MAARLFPSNQQSLHNLPTTGNEQKTLPSLSSSYFSTQQEYHAYLHQTILSNLPYYTALARYRDLRRSLSTGKKKGKGRMWRKNLRVYFRLTESGLCLLKTGFAKKPKSPV